jgi:serine/threonine protein kinase
MQPGYLLRNRYRIEQRLSAGAFGETYIAVDENPDYPIERRVVVKHLKPQDNDPKTLKVARELFEKEAKTLAKLGETTDRIPTLYAYFEEKAEVGGEEKSEFYLVQELIEGQTLSKELGNRKLDEIETLKIIQNILIGLEKVHNSNNIHRDLKPDNIIRRNSNNKLVLIDFGAVKAVRQGSNPQISQTIGIGTPGYMPGEQWRGSPQFASDIYAVGAIALKCLTGIEPSELQDKDSGEFKWRHLCQVNDRVANVLYKMVAILHPDRYANARIAKQEIESLISSSAPPQISPLIPVPIPIPIPVPLPIQPPIPIPIPVPAPVQPIPGSQPPFPLQTPANQRVSTSPTKQVQQPVKQQVKSPVNKGVQPPATNPIRSSRNKAKTPSVNPAQPSRIKGLKNTPKKYIQQILLISMIGVGLVSALVSFGGLFSTSSNRSSDVSITTSNSSKSSPIEIPLQSSSLPSKSPKLEVKLTPTPTPAPTQSPSESPKSDSDSKVIEEVENTERTSGYKILELSNYKLNDGEKFQNINNSKMTLKTNGGDHTYYIINSQGWLTATDTESVLAVPDNPTSAERNIKDNTNEYQIINKHLEKYGKECLHDEYKYASYEGCLWGIVHSKGKNELRGYDSSGHYYRQDISIVTIYMPVKVRRNSAKLKDFKKDLKLAISQINKR